MIEDLIEGAVEAGIANPEAAERLGVGLLVVAGVLWLVVWWLARPRPRRRRPALVASPPHSRRRPVPPPFALQFDDPTQVLRAQADRTEVFPAAFPDPWGAAGVRRG